MCIVAKPHAQAQSLSRNLSRYVVSNVLVYEIGFAALVLHYRHLQYHSFQHYRCLEQGFEEEHRSKRHKMHVVMDSAKLLIS